MARSGAGRWRRAERENSFPHTFRALLRWRGHRCAMQKNRWEIERSIQLVGIERKPKRARSPWLLQVASAAEVASALVAHGRLDRV